ncbi:MAG TPA: pyrroline-5-carboxylate reductase [Lachnospiraceae bacterium]|nr:pyrroline-5-carboxylate reductase [Lachnospiraceae bacterium]
MKIGFIGCGNMGGTMMQAMLDAGKCAPENIMASARSEERLRLRKEQMGVQVTTDNRRVAAFAETLFLAVKPQCYEKVIEEIREQVTADQLIVTIAPGKTLDWLAGTFGRELKIIRAMPNAPAMVRAGMMALCPNARVSEEELAGFRELCSSFGSTEVVEEHLMDVVTAVAGSSPAYVFMFIEAMADAAVAAGMSRAASYKFASQAVLGSAKMVLDTGKHPGELKDMICSPGGTTIEAVRVLEEKGMRSAVFEAVKACVDKSRGM